MAESGDRRQRRKARTRRDLYAAAMRLFMARGYDAVTVEQICAEADVARATFFLHFPTKDALLGEYADQATAEVAACLAEHPGHAEAALRAAMALLAERATQHAAIVHLVVRETVARPGGVARSTEQGRTLGELLAGTIAAGQRAGTLRRGVDPLVAALTVVAAYLAIVGEWVRREERFDLRTAVERALDVVLHGLVRQPGARSGKER